MSEKTKTITREQAQASHKWSCDGIARYSIKGVRHPLPVVYSSAYDMIFLAAGGTVDGEGRRTFTPDALRRIMKLNARYAAVAIDFIKRAVQADLLVASYKAAQANKPETTPELTPDATLVSTALHSA